MKPTYKKKVVLTALAVAAATVLLGCAMAPTAQEVEAATQQVIKSSFRDQGIAKMDRLTLDASNKACSESAGAALDAKLAKGIEEANLKTVKLPSDGKFLGNWQEGERIAQNGRGMTWTDAATATNGGSCYNCHQISKAELSFGSIGPSLYNYGKLRGGERPGCRGQQAHRRIHMGQALELQGLQRMLRHAPLRPCGHPERATAARRHGAAAGPEVARQPVTAADRQISK